MLMDKQSHEMFKMPAQYMFKDIPQIDGQEDYVAYTVAQMDKHNIERAMIGVGPYAEQHKEALRRFPDRFFACYEANPNNGMDEVRTIVALKEEFDIKAVTASPAMICPPVPVNDKKWYPIYAKACGTGYPVLSLHGYSRAAVTLWAAESRVAG